MQETNNSSSWISRGFNNAIWGAGKVLQYGILKPTEILGRIAESIENKIWGNEEPAQPKPLTERDISHKSEDSSITEFFSIGISSEEDVLKNEDSSITEYLSGSESEKGPTREELEIEISRLKQQIAELKSHRVKERMLGAGREGKEMESGEESEEISPNKISKKIAIFPKEISSKKRHEDFKAIADEGATVTTEKTQAEARENLVEDYSSPIYNHVEEDDKTRKGREELEAKNYLIGHHELDPVLFDLPVLQKLPMKKRTEDETLMLKYGIDAQELKHRRDALLEVFKTLNGIVKNSTNEIRTIERKNDQIIGNARRFESGRVKDLETLKEMDNELERAKQKAQILNDQISIYQSTKKNDEDSGVKLRFAKDGEAKGEIFPIKEVVEKNLISGYEEEIERQKDLIKQKILEININKRKAVNLYKNAVLIYPLKSKSVNGDETTEIKQISLYEFYIKEINVRVEEKAVEIIRKQLETYKVKLPSEAKAEASTDKIKEQQDMMQKELAAKLTALKPSNVADYSIEIVEDQ